MFEVLIDSVKNIALASGFANVNWQQLVMIVISCALAYLAIAKGYEPLLLLPIAFGMMLTNIPNNGLFHMEFYIGNSIDYGTIRIWK